METSAGLVHPGSALSDSAESQSFYTAGMSTPSKSGRRSPKYKEGRVSPIANGRKSPKGGGCRPQNLLGRFSPSKQDGRMSPSSKGDNILSPPMILDVGMSPSQNGLTTSQDVRMSPTQSGRLSPSNGRKSPRATSIGPEESPIVSKRRKIDLDPLLDSPMSSASTDTLHQSFRSSPERSFFSSHDEWSDSCLSSPQASPLGLKARRAKRGNYKKAKEDLWAAIESDYQYLMDDEIIETCKSTESDLSWDDDDAIANPNVSFAEFIQQYKELTDWLNQIKLVTQRQSMSLSEKYLNQSYHEEMLQRSPRRKLFNDYAKQLAKRYPNMKEEINVRLQYLNSQWGHIQEAISPKHGHQNEEQMLRDLEQDLNGLRRWLHEVEVKLLPLCLRVTWGRDELEAKLRDHQVLQRDIESRSKIVSAVLKLCERLEGDKRACSDEDDKDSVQLAALNLERRWHAIWLQSLEWQCRLEEAISRKKGLTAPVSQASSFGGFNFPSQSHLTLPPLHDIGDSERSDYTDTDADDFNNSDVIPFPENEYEKITSEADTPTEKGENSDKKEPSLSTGDLIEVKDGNEERSLWLSDKQGRTSEETLEHASMERDTQRPSKVTKGSGTCHSVGTDGNNLEVMGSSPPTKDDDLYTMVVSALTVKDSTTETATLSDDSKLESHDVGYSSGGQSNEEVEYSITETKQEMKTTKILVGEVQRTSISIRKEDSLEASTSEINESTFTNVSSLPSGEESPYQATLGDDSSVAQEGQEQLGEDSEKYEEALSSPSKRFYRMTSIEAEFSADNTGSNVEVLTNGYKSGSESDTQSNAKVRTRLEFLIQDLEHRLEEDAKPRSRASSASAFGFDEHDSSSPLTSDEEQAGIRTNSSFIENLDTFEDYNHTLEIYKTQNERSSDEKSESLAVQANSDSDHQEVTQNDEVDGPPPCDLDHIHIPNSRESVERLVRQAESFVRDGDFNIQMNRWSEMSGKRRRRRKKREYASTDSSANEHPGNYVESSCDASSEYTSESESSSSNEENLYSSVIFKETAVTVDAQNADSATATGGSLSAENSPKRDMPQGVKMRRKTNRHKQNGRPWSVTELYELTNRLDFSPFSISEGALDILGGSHPDSLNKVSGSGSELCSWRGATLNKMSPNHKRKHHTKLMQMKRSVSESEKLSHEQELGSSESPKESTKSLSEHETLYAMVSGALDAKEPSESSPEDKSPGHLLPVSGEESLSDLGDLVNSEKQEVIDSDKDSDDTDELLNSTVESFSEHAWDPYQDPPYQVVTSDDNEEKLDDSHLTWENEDNFEFDDDYIKDSGMFSTEFLSALQPQQSTPNNSNEDGMAASAASNGYPSPSAYSGDSSRVDDSDSDMEDFQHVINESAKQIQVTETSLKKQRKDAMETGLCLDPSKYAELVATCETNLRCLQVIVEHLNAGKSLVGLTEEDVNRVYEIMACWKDLHSLAVDKQSKSRQLSAIHQEMQMIHKYLRDLENGLEQGSFDGIKSVEEMIKVLQEAKLNISEQKTSLTTADMRVSEFDEQNPDINMQRFKKECTALCSRFKEIETRSLTRTAELQNLLLAWYDYSETSKELDYLLCQQRQHMQLMQAGHQFLIMSAEEMAETTLDIKNVLTELEAYEAKMVSIRQLSAQLLPLCSSETKMDIRASVGTLSNQLEALKHDCKKMATDLLASISAEERVEENMDISPEAEALVVEAEGLDALVGSTVDTELRRRYRDDDSPREATVEASDVPMETNENEEDKTLLANAAVAAESAKARPVGRWIGRLAFCRRILKVAIPLQILLILLFGLAMLLEPDCCEYFNNFRLTFAPQLRYVRGPPPI